MKQSAYRIFYLRLNDANVPDYYSQVRKMIIIARSVKEARQAASKAATEHSFIWLDPKLCIVRGRLFGAASKVAAFRRVDRPVGPEWVLVE